MSENKFSKGSLGVEPPEAPQDSRFLELLQGFPQCLGWQLGQGLGARTLVKFSLSPFRANWGLETPETRRVTPQVMDPCAFGDGIRQKSQHQPKLEVTKL